MIGGSVPKVSVIGGGIIGLTCAYELAKWADVTVYRDRDVSETASYTATAIWHVYLVDQQDETYLRWSGETLKRFLSLRGGAGDGGSGVGLCHGVELFRTTERYTPSWSDIALDYRELNRTDLSRFPGITWGYEITAPVVDISVYLRWLESTVRGSGVRFVRGHVRDLEELSGEMVVNCTGLEARRLVEDDEIFPVRGQYLVLGTKGDIPDTYVGDDEHPDGMAYMIPRAGEILVGGTAEEDKWGLEFSADVGEMLDRALTFCPDLDRADLFVKRRVVGLRPCRRSGRVRFGWDPDMPNVFHNYGHGGSGWSLSWGCAAEVSRIVAKGPVAGDPR